jgi:gliding motility-associated-like protein
LITGNWSWGGCCTDGGVIEDIGCSNTINLDLLVSSGINSIVWLTGDITNPTTINLGLTGEAITINCGGGVCCPVGLDTGVEVMNATCPDSENGSINVYPQDGIGPYTFDWSNGETTASITDLAPGTYTVTITDSQGCTEDLAMIIDVSPGNPEAEEASLELCSETNEAEFDLTVVEDVINLSSGFDVLWFENSDLTGPISDPQHFLSPSTTIYAVVDNGPCLSDPVPVVLTVIPVPIGTSITVNQCEESNEMSTFDLTLLDQEVSGGAGDVTWYLDPNLNNPVLSPVEFVTGSTTVYAVINDGICNSAPVEVELIVDLKPEGFATSMELCGDANDEATFDLTLLELTVSDGNGNVTWFLNEQLLDEITVPSAFVTTTTEVYAVVFDGICNSDPVEVDLIVNPTPVGIPITISTCDEGSGMATINLWDYASLVSGGAGAVEWFLDFFLSTPVPDPIAFQTGSTMIYAMVDNGICTSGPVQIQINILDSPVANPTALEICSDTSGQGIFNLTLADLEVSGGVGPVVWYEDVLGQIPILTPTAYSSMGGMVYAQIVLGNCQSSLVPVTLVIISGVNANPAMTGACNLGNDTALFNLVTIENQVSGGTGQVFWYLDSGGTMILPFPDSFPSGNTTIYANVVAGTCVSAIVDVQLNVLPIPIAQDLMINYCGNDSSQANIILTALDTMLHDSLMNVSWFSDGSGTVPVVSTSGFISGDTIVYATVSNGVCQSLPVTVEINVLDLLTANPLNLGYCLTAGDSLHIDLTLYDTTIGSATLDVLWFIDSLGTFPVVNTHSFSTGSDTTLYVHVTDGICISPVVPIDFEVQTMPVANPFSISRCGDANGFVTVDLTNVESAVSQNSGIVNWYADENFTIPLANIDSLVTGDTIVYANVTNGSCFTGIVPVSITVVDSLLANPAIVQVCVVDDDHAVIDLSTYDLSISSGGGPVFWFADSLQMVPIDPLAYETTGDTVYAIVMADGCISNLAQIPIVVDIVSTPDPVCTFTSIDSVSMEWPDVATDYEIAYSINGQLIGVPFMSNSAFFNTGGLDQSDTVVLSVTAIYSGICSTPLTSSVTCITDVCPSQSVQILGLDNTYCHDELFVLLQASPSGGQFTGEGVSGDTLYPSIVGGGNTTVHYQWDDVTTGCVYETEANVSFEEPLESPILDCDSADLDFVSFSWSGSAITYGYQYSINQGSLSSVLLTTGKSLTISNLAEGDEVNLALWAVGDDPCGNSDTVFASCNTRQCLPVNLTILHPEDICFKNEPVQLGLDIVGQTTNPVISWTGIGIIHSSGIFDPASAIAGSQNHVEVVLNDLGCVYHAEAFINVIENPVAAFDVSGIPCLDSALTVSFTGTAYFGADFQYDVDGGTIIDDNRPLDFKVQWNTPGTYSLQLFINDLICTSDTFKLEVGIDEPLSPPVISCIEEAYYSIVVEWEPVARATGYQVTSSSGTGTLSGTSYSIHNLKDDSPVIIQVVANGPSECGPSSASIECRTQDYIPPLVYIPNVFSPNGDGINDVFLIQTNDRVAGIVSFRIFDRWGNVVFEDFNFLPNEPQHGWDGLFRGKEMNPAVFTYIAELTDLDGGSILKAGEVTLVR